MKYTRDNFSPVDFMERTGLNKTEASDALGVTRQSLYRYDHEDPKQKLKPRQSVVNSANYYLKTHKKKKR